MKQILLSISLMTLVGCGSSHQYVSHPMTTVPDSQNRNGGKHYHNYVKLSAPSLWTTSDSPQWMEVCKSKIEHPQTEEEFIYPFTDCVMATPTTTTSTGSMTTQAIAPVATSLINASGFALGMHMLGRGIAKSGNQTTNNNNTSSEGNGGEGGSSSSSSSATNNVNSGNKTTNANKTTNINNSKTNINSNNHNHMGGHKK